MKSKYHTSLLAILLIVAIFISGCIQQSQPLSKCPTCPNPSAWSSCSEEAMKMKTNYRCSAETNYTCESYTENKTCLTELSSRGETLEVLISPTADETVKGIIKVEATKVPDRTTKVEFFLMPQNIQFDAQMTPEELAKVIPEADTSGVDGWKVFFDVTKVENGLYKIFIGATYEGAPEVSPWLDKAQAQVVVKN